jgi:hypothetical protein
MVPLVFWTVCPGLRQAILAPSATFKITFPVLGGRRVLGLIVRVRIALACPSLTLFLLRIQIDALVCARNARLCAMGRAIASSRSYASIAAALLDGAYPINKVCRLYLFVVRSRVALLGVRDALLSAQPVPGIARHAFLSSICGAPCTFSRDSV